MWKWSLEIVKDCRALAKAFQSFKPVRFYFRAKNGQETKRGLMKAPDRDTAFAILVQDGLTVLELREATPQELKAEKGERGSESGDSDLSAGFSLSAGTGTRKVLERVSLVIALLGVVGFLFSWDPPGFGESTEVESSSKLYSFEIEGRVPGPKSKDVQICFREIPLILRPRQEELSFDSDGKFKATFELELTKKPLEFFLTSDGINTASFSLEGEQTLRGQAF